MEEKKAQKLIKKVKKGNQRAFKQLYEMYAEYALRTAYAINRNSSDASDVVQETFIKVFRNIESYDMNKPFKPWFYQILTNESRRYLVRKKKEGVCIDSERVLEYLNHEQQNELHVMDIGDALEQLNEMHRTVIILKYLDGFSEKDIAEVLKLNVNTVKSRLYQARRKLKVALGGGKDE